MLALVACSGSSQGASGRGSSAPAGKADPLAAAGKQLFVAKGCIACHRAPGVPEATGTIGPSLADIGNPSKRPKLAANVDNNRDNLKRWVLNPQGLKPGTTMPNLGLSDDEANKLVAFLETLK